MDGVDPGERDRADADPTLTVQALADLQAGLLDDDTAARLRTTVREDPDAAQTLHALHRVRRDVAALGTDTSSAPAVAAAVVDRIGAALRDAPSAANPSRPRLHAAHTVGRGKLPRPSRPGVAVAGLAGVAAAIVAAWLGATALIKAPGPTSSRPTTVEHITVSRPAAVIGLSDQQILALVDRELDFGMLADPQRRASCLRGLGYPTSTRVLGARPIAIAGRPAVLLVFPGDTPGTATALAVAPNCSSVDTGLLADRLVHRP
jgi:hypothetical protein